MESYQCPDCLGVHEEATEPVVGIFVRCEPCMLVQIMYDPSTSGELLEPELAQFEAA
jgi:hypothetical protein